MTNNVKHTVPPEELMAYLDGQLGEERCDQIAAHLPTCPHCRSLLESLESVDRCVADAEKAEAPEGYFETFASRVSSRIAQQKLATVKAKPAWFLRWGWMPTAAVVALAVVVVMSIDYQREMKLGTQRLAEKSVPAPLPEIRSAEKVQPHTVAPEARPGSTPTLEVAREKEVAESPAIATPAQPAVGSAISTDELAEGRQDLAASRVETAPALAGKMSPSSDKKGAERDRAAAPASEEAMTKPTASLAEPTPAAPPAMDLELRRSAMAQAPATGGIAKVDADKSKDARQQRLARTKPRTGIDTMARKTAAVLDVGPADVSEVQAIVIYVPDHNDSLPSPEVRKAIRIDMR